MALEVSQLKGNFLSIIYKIILLIFSSFWSFSCYSSLGYASKSKNFNKTKNAEITNFDSDSNELTTGSFTSKRSVKDTANNVSLTGISSGSAVAGVGSSGVSGDASSGSGTDDNASNSSLGSPGTDADSGDSSSSTGSQGGSGSIPGKPVKTELSNITSVENLLDEKVLKYLNAIITGNEGGDGRTSLIPSGGFSASAVTETKYGITPDCTSNSGTITCKKSNNSNATPVGNNETENNNNNTYNHGYYFEIAQGSGSRNNIYTYRYEAYRANETDFYITGEIQATVHNTNVELKGQVRIHPTYNDAVNSADDVIIVKFGEGNVENDNDNGFVSLDRNNVPESGKLTITLTKGGNSDTSLEKTYDLHATNRSTRLSEDDKKVINNLGLFRIN